MKVHKLSFDSNGGSDIVTKEIVSNQILDNLPTPVKNGSTFGGWYTDAGLTQAFDISTPITSDMILYAKRGTENSTTIPTVAGGGSGRIVSTKSTDASDTSKDNEHNSAEKEEKQTVKEENKVENKDSQEKQKKNTLNERLNHQKSKQNTTTSSQPLSRYYNNISTQDNEAYVRARENNITTQPPEEANPNGYLKRGEMAKMVVNFAINVLGMKLPEHYPQCAWADDVNDFGGKELKSYASKACALGLMGINTEYFNPKQEVTRAQFGTILSRMLWGDTNNIKDTKEKPYYTDHLKALKANGIMENIIDPTKTKEVRKRVWTMMKRTVEGK